MRSSIYISNLIAYSVLGLLIVTLFVLYYKKHARVTSTSSIVQTLYRQCARWAVAAEQDDSEIIQVLHANYATGYLWAIKDIVANDEFEKITGTNFLEFEKKIVTIQDNATAKLVSTCKSVVPIQDPTLLKAIYKAP